MKRRRTAFVALLLLFLVLAGWWVFYLPYRAERLYDLVPGRARFVSEHIGLSSRWARWRETGVLDRMGEAMGMEAGTPAHIAGPQVARFVERFCARHTIVGYLPAPHGGTWFLATWIGGYGQWMRWGVARPWPEGWAPMRVGKRTAWVGLAPESGQDRYAAVSVVEGVLVGCLSADPHAIEEFVALAELGRAALGSRFPGLAEADDGGEWSDRAHGTWYARRGPWGVPQGITLRFRPEAGTRLSGSARLTPSPPACSGKMRVGACSPVVGILGTAPAAVAALPVTAWDALRGEIAGSEDVGLADLLTTARRDVPAMLALLRPEWKGRLMGFPVPVLVAAIPLRKEADAAEHIAKCLDGLNVRHGLGLFPRRIDAEAWTVTVIDDSRSGFLSRVDAQYRPAFAVMDEWLLFATSADALGRLLRQADGVERGAPDWLARMDAHRHGGAVWIDSDPACVALENALAVASLGMMQSGNAGDASRNALAQASDAIRRVRRLGSLCVWAPVEPPGEYAFDLILARPSSALSLDSGATLR